MFSSSMKLSSAASMGSRRSSVSSGRSISAIAALPARPSPRSAQTRALPAPLLAYFRQNLGSRASLIRKEASCRCRLA